ncbi:MAG: isochorismatase family protein [Myxococcales bacterium]|nr:isochorismatase family protein [Myxococcales bacterium]
MREAIPPASERLAVLLTQSIQNDMVAPIGRFDPIPNKLHVGHAEALRLMGENPAEGPVARTMRWAQRQPDTALRLIHIRDWHDPSDPSQRSHLELFGEHCLQHSEGAAFAFPHDPGDKDVAVVDSLTLNDFVGTQLEALLEPHRGQSLRVGLMGVWTEAKISFLAYELRTRYPEFDLAVCSALTASSSRAHHFQALDQLRRLLGVRIIDSVGEFIDFLGSQTGDDAPLVGLSPQLPIIEIADKDGEPATLELAEVDRTLIRYLFRSCRLVRLRVLDGGFSGNIVCGTHSVDLEGQEQVPHVIKIGDQGEMGRERACFERVQDVLGNNAPSISDFADIGERGAIKYRYASMGGSFSTTFQREFQAGLGLDAVAQILDTVFGEQLMRLYKAASLEAGDLLEHYGFRHEMAPRVHANVEAILGRAVGPDTIELLPGVEITNPARFYAQTLASLPARAQDSFHQAYVHGDLNGQNIILDGHRNVWLIDFFHTRRAHVIMDLVKLENDLLFLWTPVADEDELRRGFALIDALLEVRDLAAPLDRAPEAVAASPAMARAWTTLAKLRSFYPPLIHSDRDPFQLWVALLRYAGHTLSFDEAGPLQKLWALYAACRLSARISESLIASTRLRVDFVEPAWAGAGRVGLTLLPGRRDYGRDLGDDLATLRADGIGRVLCMVPRDELERYGVGDLLDAYREAGLTALHLPVVDQKASSVADMDQALAFIDAGVQAGEAVLVHCVGGLGRSGMAVACYLGKQGLDAAEAIARVRGARGPRAVETAVQEDFVRGYLRTQ